MHPTRILLASLLALTLGTTPAHSQATAFNTATPINVSPDACCACLTLLDIHGYEAGPMTPPPLLNVDNDGTASAAVKIRHDGGTNCPASISITVGARSTDGNHIHPTTRNLNLAAATTSEPLEFLFTAEHLRLSESWEIYFSCDSAASNTETTGECEPPYEVRLTSCAACASCEGTGEPSVNEDGTVEFSTTTSNGGATSGAMRFTPGGLSGSGQLTNPGSSALTANVPKSFGVNTAGGKITSITTGNTTVEVAPATDAIILADDPNAFVITHTTDGAPASFRTTTISLKDDNGTKILRIDSDFEVSITRHAQSQPTPGTRVHEQGRVIGDEFISLRQETIITTNPTPGTRTERRTVRERTSTSVLWENAVVISDVETTWEEQIKGWVKTREIIDPQGDALTSTWAYYPPGEPTGPGASAKGLGRLKHHVRYDGYESIYTYELHKTTVKTPYAGTLEGKTTITQWQPGAGIQTTTTLVNGEILSTHTTAHALNSRTRTVHTSAGQTLTTTTTYKTSGQDFGGKPIRILHADGTLTTYEYSRDETTGGITTTTENGEGANGSVTKGTRSITTTNSRGTTILSKTEAIGHGTGSASFSSIAVTSVDNLGRATAHAYHSPSSSIAGEVATAPDAAWSTTTQYSCCGIAKETDQYGITTQHAYDHLQRRIKTNHLGVTTEMHYLGLTTETYRYPEIIAENSTLSPELIGNSTTLVSKSVSNLAGTLQESWSPDPTSSTPGALVKSSTTTTTYDNAGFVQPPDLPPVLPIALPQGIGTRVKITTADNHTQTTDSFLDGRTAKTYGDLSPAMEYAYSVNATGELTSASYIVGDDLVETSTTQTDRAGRTVQTAKGTIVTNYFYFTSTDLAGSRGKLARTIDADGVTTLMAYNTRGERTTTALKLNTLSITNIIAYGTDTVQFSETVPALSGGNPVWLTTSKVWQPGQTNPTGGTIVFTSTRAPNGLSGSSQSIGVASPSTSLTILSGNGNWTTTSTSPDGTKTVGTYTAGRLTSSSSLLTDDSALFTQSYAYDTLNRPISTTDSRTGTTTTAYLSATNDAVASVTDPGNRTTAFTYDNRSRQIEVNAPDTLDAEGNNLTNITFTAYNPDGTIQETSGAQTYRTTHTYDYAQRQVTMTTYGTETATTGWKYSPDRGFLTEKNYHGETDDGNVDADYTYTAAGRLLTRTWERGKHTRYAYDAAGRMESTRYFLSRNDDTGTNPGNDADTPDVTITHDALGRQLTQSNGVAQSTFAYNSSNLAIDTETVQYDLDPGTAGFEFTRVLDRSQDNLGRDSGWKFGTVAQYDAGWIDGNGDPDSENAAVYSYGTTDGRLASVSGGGLHPPSQFTYGYEPNSHGLLKTITGPAHTVTNSWESTRDVLSSKENKVGATNISSYNYGVNSIGQRTNVAKTGTAFAGVLDITWGYNSKGEVVKADHTLPGLDRAYVFDGIGNRLSGGGLHPPSQTTYTPNALNQYSAINNQSSIINPQFDADGNMTSGPLPANVNANSTLIWDGENRLIEAQVNGGGTVTFIYDSQSRRIAETIGSASKITIYDGWNPIAEYSISNNQYSISKAFTWGVDLSGSMQGAGGVGGLLAVTDGTGTYFPTFDGNGNVSEYLDSTGAIAAHYEYDPFGRTTVATGPKANDFAHRFTTKPLDASTGLYYYGYRFYDPNTGRWPSRDSIEEEGGLNLYGFVGNEPVSWIDILGSRAYYGPGSYHYHNNNNTQSSPAVLRATFTSLLNLAQQTLYSALLQKCTMISRYSVEIVGKSAAGKLQCCTRADCMAQAFRIARGVRRGVEAVIDAQLHATGSVTSGLWGNASRYCGSQTANNCVDWQSLVNAEIMSELSNDYQEGSLCWITFLDMRDGAGLKYEHHWVTMAPAFRRGDPGVRIDPWPSGGRVFIPTQNFIYNKREIGDHRIYPR